MSNCLARHTVVNALGINSSIRYNTSVSPAFISHIKINVTEARNCSINLTVTRKRLLLAVHMLSVLNLLDEEQLA